MAWGPDLSGTLGGAGGIGGLAILDDDAAPDTGYAAPGPMIPVYDGNGNVVQMVSTTDATPKASYEYGPFGEVKELSGQEGQRNPFRWSTKWTDAETGLVYYGYRYYSASTGRWLGRDPIEEYSHRNWYCLLGNDSLGHIDPKGLQSMDCGGACDPSSTSSSLLPDVSKSRWQEEARFRGGFIIPDYWRMSVNATGPTIREMTKIYLTYAQYYAMDSRLLWAGAASLVGVQAIPGIKNLDRAISVHEIFTQSSYLRGARHQLVSMAQDIFEDLAWQHEVWLAYPTSEMSLTELRAHVDQNNIPSYVFFRGWCRLAHAQSAGDITAANIELLRYEQQQVIQQRYDVVGADALMSTALNFLVEPPFPGPRGFRSVVPGGDLTNFNDRWQWMQTEVMPRWGQLSHGHRAWLINEAVEYYLHIRHPN